MHHDRRNLWDLRRSMVMIAVQLSVLNSLAQYSTTKKSMVTIFLRTQEVGGKLTPADHGLLDCRFGDEDTDPTHLTKDSW